MAWDDGLEGRARDFAASDASRIRCLAGPGTGKTFALMRRIQRLLEVEEVPAERILVVTLTRTAADDLRANLHRLGVEGADQVVTSTLHSLCLSLLVQEGVLDITQRTPRLLANFERDLILKDLHDDLGTFTQKQQLLNEFEAAWSAMDGTFLDVPPGSLRARFLTALVGSLRWHECMLLEELVPVAQNYLSENPYSPVLDRFDHILVDEYQDLNRADHAVVELLAQSAIGRGGAEAIIGDDDQCIYVDLRHAHPSGIVEFAADVDVPLLECRRCPTTVTAMAQSLIEHNPGRAKPALEPRPGNVPGVIHNVAFRSMQEEMEGIAEFVHARLTSHTYDPGEVLILANWRVIAYGIRDRLIELGYDAHSYFREEALDSTEAKRALTLLTLLARPEDRVALRAYLALSSATEERAAYRRIVAHASQEDVSAMAVLDELHAGTLHIPYTGRAVDAYVGLQSELDELEPVSADLEELVNRLCPAGDASTARLREAMERARGVQPECGTLSGFESSVRAQIESPDVPLEAPFVRLMSLHKSKGLTVKLVVIAGLVEGLVPRRPKRPLTGAQRADHDQEQRRILYVGITRATEELVLSRFGEIDTHSAHLSGAETGRWVGRGTMTTVSSTLLRELGPRLPRILRGEDWVY